MARKKKKNDVMSFGTGIIGTSLLSQTAGGIGGDVAASGQAGLSNIAGFYPAMGTTMGAGMTLGLVDRLKPPRKKKRRR